MSLRARLAVAFSVVVAIGVAAASTAGYISTRAELANSTDEFLASRSMELAQGVRSLDQGRQRPPRPGPPGDAPSPGGESSGARQGDQPEGEGQAVRLPFDPDAISQAIAEDGTVVASAGGNLPVTAEDIALAQPEPGLVPLLRTVTIDDERHRMITRHIRGGGAVQVARSLSEDEAVLVRLRNRSLVIGLGLSLAAAAAGWWITRAATKPLRELTVAAEQIAETKDLQPGLGFRGTDDVGRLAASFDEMLAALAQSREQQHQLIHDAGHELRTPLTTLKANVELLQRAPDLEGEPREALLNAIETELSELNVLFAELIELATDSRDETPLTQLDLNDPVERALDVFSVRSERPVEVSYVGATVLGDSELLERAVANLLNNADKFSPAGTPLEVQVRGGAVTVGDQGPGIDPADQARVFDRFWRSQDARAMPGSGLGLAIVKKIVEQHNGTVTVDSGPDQGATVGFRLPEIQT